MTWTDTISLVVVAAVATAAMHYFYEKRDHDGGHQMTWTTDKPTTPGWYWYRYSFIGSGLSLSTCTMLMRVFEEDGRMSCTEITADGNTEPTFSLDEIGGRSSRWAGPIEPPPEDERETNP